MKQSIIDLARAAALAGASVAFLILFGFAHGIPLRVMLRVLRGGEGG